MPNVGVIDLNPEESQEVNPVEQNLVSFFSSLGKNYKDKQDKVEIGKIIDEYSQNKDKANAVTQYRKAVATGTLSPTKQLQAMELINAEEKAIQERDKTLNAQTKALQDAASKKKVEEQKIAEQSRKDEENRAKSEKTKNEVREILLNGGEDPKEAERLSSVLTPVSASARVKSKAPVKGTAEKFEETIAVEAAKEVPKLEKEIIKADDVLSNIERIQELSDKQLGGPLGYVKAALNTESASELTTLGATNLDTVIKLFNPAGTLPTAKLNWIRNTFSVSPWDNQSTITGKLNTQRLITEQGKKRAQERVALLKQYKGNIPTEVATRFDNDSSKILDQIERPGYVQVKAPNGKFKWVPTDIANQLEGQ